MTDTSERDGVYRADLDAYVPERVTIDAIRPPSTPWESDGEVDVSWTPITGARGFQVAHASRYRARSGYSVAESKVAGLTYTLTGLPHGPGCVRVIGVMS